MMSETEKKGSPWPWILVPIAAFTLFFVLRECQKRLPPAVNATPAIATPATEGAPAPAASSASGPEAAAPAATPAPQ